jgi:hypothetical protein
LHLGPWNNLGAHRHSPGRSQEQRRRRRRFPVRELAGGDGKWGKGKRKARATRRRSCRGRGRPGARSAAEQRLAGGGERRRRRSGTGGRVRTGRGDALDHEEAILGVDLGRGGAEQGGPRRADGRRVQDGGEDVRRLRRGRGGNGRVQELPGGERKLAGCSVWVEEW